MHALAQNEVSSVHIWMFVYDTSNLVDIIVGSNIVSEYHKF